LSLSSMVACMDIAVSVHHMAGALAPGAAIAQLNPQFARFMPRFSG